MPFVISIKDAYRQAVEAATGGRNTVMYDDMGYPSIMVCIPKFYLDEVIAGAPHQPHPAFIVNGVEKSEIWIGKYPAVVHNGRACSLPGQDPSAGITFEQARQYCAAKGPGWHLMTNAEWAAIALWCRKNGFLPRGNTKEGASTDAPHEHGVLAPNQSDSYRTLTGSGPASWYHDGTTGGIADLCGNVWEWVDGLKLVNGRIYVHPDNNYTVGNAQGSVDGWLDTGIYFDNTTPGDADQSDHNVGGDPILSDVRTNPMYTGGDTNALYGWSSVRFRDLQTKSGVTVPDLLKWLAICPVDGGDYGEAYVWVRNYGERVSGRGCSWYNSGYAGIFAFSLQMSHTSISRLTGLRPAFISP